MHSLIPLLLPVASLFATAKGAPTTLPEDSVNKLAITKRGQWASQGCVTDNALGVRALEHSLGSFDDLTPDKCNSLCEAQGFNLSGVEWRKECYCGNTIMGDNRPLTDSSCSLPCSGDPNQQCGGDSAIHIYAKDNYAWTHGPPLALDSYNGYQRTQCWQEPPNARLMTGVPAQPIPGDSMTVQKCIDGCAAAGYASAGVEFGRECWCGNPAYPVGQSTSMYECSMGCTGDGSQLCGGPERIIIYNNPSMTPVNPTNPTTPGGLWAPAQGGCWYDKVNNVRTLEHPLGSFDDLTIEKCLTMCDAQGFSLAGVEFSRECFCGNTIMGNSRPVYTNTCTMPCSGNSRQACGGRDSINIYVKNNYPYTVGPATVFGGYNNYASTTCWQDSTNNRILSGRPLNPIPANLMTVQRCIDGCAAAGYSDAGVEFGQECYCGNATYPPGQSENMAECNMPCAGDASQYCGGPDRMIIYHKYTPVPNKH